MLKLIYIHCKPDQGYDDRFDTVMNVNGSIAVLNSITRDLLGYPGLAIDESYPGAGHEGKEREYVLSTIREKVEEALNAGDEPVVYCSLLSYNAVGSLDLLRQLKADFGKRLRTGVGGQLVHVCPNAYRSGENRSFIDQVADGDAEVLLEPMLIGRNAFEHGDKKISSTDHYAAPYYGDNSYLGLTERLEEMAQYDFCGVFHGMRQLITESVRGCAWAHTRRRCKFCALKGVNDIPLFRDFSDHFRIERELVEEFGVNWLFDVSNQWLPTIIPKLRQQWLTEYVAARKQHNAPDINRYVYLTTNSITRDSAPLLREAGVRIAYVGIDGWDKSTKAANYKTLASSEEMLEACKANNLYVRTSLVIGSGLTEENLEQLPTYVEETLAKYGGNTILSFGNFLEIVLPGSDDWDDFKREAELNSLTEAEDIYRCFETNGYLTLDQQDKLNELRVRHTQKLVDYELVKAKVEEAKAKVEASPALSVTFRKCDKLHKSSG